MTEPTNFTDYNITDDDRKWLEGVYDKLTVKCGPRRSAWVQ